MRIVSLVPHATELLFALGLGDDVVAVTHECDFPTEARSKPSITRDVLAADERERLSAGEIDAAVRERTERGESIYELDEEVLRELEPDLIVTQELCPVCAVSYDDVAKIAADAARVPAGDLAGSAHARRGDGRLRTVAQATGARDAALDLIARLRSRIDAVRLAVRGADRPRVAALEWFDPVFVAGHWTPQLIELAGGEDVLGFAGEHSETSTWETVAAARPDVVLCIPCGYDAERSHAQASLFADAARARSAPSASSRSTLRRTSRAPGRGWSTGSSCSPTSCTRTGSPRAATGRARARRRGRALTPRRRAPSSTCTLPAAATAPTASCTRSHRPGSGALPRRSSCCPRAASWPGTWPPPASRSGPAAGGPAPRADVAARHLARRRGLGVGRRRARPAGALARTWRSSTPTPR